MTRTTSAGYRGCMNSLMRLAVVFLGFGAVVLLIPLLDSSPDAATKPIAGALLIGGLLLLVAGVARRA